MLTRCQVSCVTRGHCSHRVL